MTEGVETASLQAWMDREGLGTGQIRDVVPLAGGTQNVMVRFARGDRSYVLRRGPLHKRPTSDDTIRREARVVAALAGTDVPHAAFVGGCPDEGVLGSAFFLVDPVDGINPSLGVPPGYDVHAMGLSLVDAAAAVGRVDHVAVGLGDLGHPDGFLARQVARWQRHLAAYAQEPAWTCAITGVDEVAGWLDAHLPTTWTPGLLHGDLHLANCLVHPTEPRVLALVDWEMATVGDPLLDLGWLLATRPADDAPTMPGGVGLTGLPTPEEIVARYADGSTRSLDDVAWYEVLACYKLGIVLEGTYVRALAGQAPTEVGERLHAMTEALFARALARIA